MSSLVEVLVAILVLTVLAIAGATYVYHSSASIAVQRNRKVATAVANTRIEELLAATYDQIKPPETASTREVHYITKTGDTTWSVSDTPPDPSETVTINNLTMPIMTTVEYIDADDAEYGTSRDYLQITVTVGYRIGTDDVVTLRTRRSPY
jgi:type II secretory pathway pseudopilin PulG